MATLTYVEASRVALREEMLRDKTIWVLGEDVAQGGNHGQYLNLPKELGSERFADTAISESCILGASVGAAMAGTRPLAEMRLADFALCATDELVQQVSKARYMLGGQVRMPIVVRAPTGIQKGFAAQHSNCLEAWFAHMPGLVVVMPATPADNKGLFKAALRSDDPVVYMEHRELFRLEGEVPDADDYVVPIGKCRIAIEGRDLTIVAWSGMVHHALAAAKVLKETVGVSVEVIDLRTIWPWDQEGVFRSAVKTGNVLIAHEAVQIGGFGAELYAVLHEQLGSQLKRIQRIGSPRMPIPYSPGLEDSWRMDAAVLVAAARKLLDLGVMV